MNESCGGATIVHKVFSRFSWERDQRNHLCANCENELVLLQIQTIWAGSRNTSSWEIYGKAQLDPIGIIPFLHAAPELLAMEIIILLHFEISASAKITLS